MRLIDTTAKSVVYSNFSDTALASEDIAIEYVAVAVDRARFREKAFVFLREHEDDVVLFKVRNGHQLTALDLSEIERRAGVERAQPAEDVDVDRHCIGLVGWRGNIGHPAGAFANVADRSEERRVGKECVP